jgi:hypothetical protein
MILARTGAILEEVDIWRRATLLIRQHGDDALFVAAQHADVQLARGDEPGCFVWTKIYRAIEAFNRQAPHEGEAVN